VALKQQLDDLRERDRETELSACSVLTFIVYK